MSESLLGELQVEAERRCSFAWIEGEVGRGNNGCTAVVYHAANCPAVTFVTGSCVREDRAGHAQCIHQANLQGRLRGMAQHHLAIQSIRLHACHASHSCFFELSSLSLTRNRSGPASLKNSGKKNKHDGVSVGIVRGNQEPTMMDPSGAEASAGAMWVCC